MSDFATATPVWEQLSLAGYVPEARTGTPCAALGGSLFVGEGIYSTTPRRLHTYNVTADKWSIVDMQGDAPETYGQTIVPVGDFLWLSGSEGLWVFSPEQRTWRDVGGQVRGASPLTRGWRAGTAVDNQLYVFGGGKDCHPRPCFPVPQAEGFNDLWMLEALGHEGLRPEAELVWTKLSAVLGGTAPAAIYGVSMASLGGRMYLHGHSETGKLLALFPTASMCCLLFPLLDLSRFHALFTPSL